MKGLRSASLLLMCLPPMLCASTPVILTRQTPDDSGKCVKMLSSPPDPESCGVQGSLTPLKRHRTYPAFGVHECAQHCFDPDENSGKNTCKSFSFDSTTAYANGAGTCTVLFRGFQQGFTPSPNSTTRFWSRSCFTSTKTNDAPLKDGNFNSDSPSHPEWYGYSTPYSYKGGKVGKIFTFESYNIDTGGEDEPGFLRSQNFTVCQGNVYQLTYENSDFKSNPDSEFQIVVNDVQLYSRQPAQGEKPLAERAPLYFQTGSRHANVSFFMYLDIPTGGESFDASTIEYIDNVVVQAVYRGSLPANTTVPIV